MESKRNANRQVRADPYPQGLREKSFAQAHPPINESEQSNLESGINE